MDDYINKPSIGERIKVIRAVNGLTGQELAKQLGVSKSTISLWERGKTKPKKKFIPKLAKLSGLSVDDFISETVYLDDEKTLEMMSDIDDIHETREIFRMVFCDNAELLQMVDKITDNQFAFFNKIFLKTAREKFLKPNNK